MRPAWPWLACWQLRSRWALLETSPDTTFIEPCQVSHEEVSKMASQLNVTCFETSAKTAKNVTESFHELVKLAR